MSERQRIYILLGVGLVLAGLGIAFHDRFISGMAAGWGFGWGVRAQIARGQK